MDRWWRRTPMCEAPATARPKRARGAVMAITVRRLFADDWRESRAIRLEALRTFPGNYFTSLAEAEARGDDVWRGMLMSATLASFGLFDGERLWGSPRSRPRIATPHRSPCRISVSRIAVAGSAPCSTRPGWIGRARRECDAFSPVIGRRTNRRAVPCCAMVFAMSGRRRIAGLTERWRMTCATFSTWHDRSSHASPDR